MTGDELAAALYAEQGAHFVATDAVLAVGSIVSCNSGGFPMTTPLRVIALASQADFDHQDELAVKITGMACGYRRRKYVYVYRTEAAD